MHAEAFPGLKDGEEDPCIVLLLVTMRNISSDTVGWLWFHAIPNVDESALGRPPLSSLTDDSAATLRGARAADACGRARGAVRPRSSAAPRRLAARHLRQRAAAESTLLVPDGRLRRPTSPDAGEVGGQVTDLRRLSRQEHSVSTALGRGPTGVSMAGGAADPVDWSGLSQAFTGALLARVREERPPSVSHHDRRP